VIKASIRNLYLGDSMNNERQTRHRRINPKTGESEFSQILEVGPEQVKKVHVVHHLQDSDEYATDAKPQPRASCRANGLPQPV